MIDLLNFFDAIVEFFSALWMMIQNIVTGTLTILQILPSVVGLPFALAPFVPALIYASVGIVVSIGVIKLILGWGNS